MEQKRVEPPLDFPILLVGEPGSGREWLRMRYKREDAPFDGWDPPIDDAFVKYVKVGDHYLKLDLIRATSQEEYPEMFQQQNARAAGVLFCFDISRADVGADLERCFRAYRQILEVKELEEFSNIVFVACKSDRVENQEEFATKMKIATEKIRTEFSPSNKKSAFIPPLIHTSARDDINVTEAFEMLFRQHCGSGAAGDPKKCIIS